MTEEQQLALALQMSMAGTMEEEEEARMDTAVPQQQVIIIYTSCSHACRIHMRVVSTCMCDVHTLCKHAN